MKRTLSLAASMIALGAAVLAQDPVEFQKWMKTAGGTAGSLKKNLDTKNGAAASADAGKLEKVFSQVHDYFHKKNVDDATKFAMTASSGFKEVGELASSGKFDDASATLKKTMSACGGCHH